MKEYTDRDLLLVHECELILLDYFIDICKKNDLTYFGWGGTGIGALRHQGFIPWDDDIDLGMPAADLDKLIEIVRSDTSGKYRVLNSDIDIEYPLSTTRLMLSGTDFCEETLRDIPCTFGIFLDLYAFDNVSDDDRLYRKQAWDAWFWSHVRLLISVPDPVIVYHGAKGALVGVASRVAARVLRLLRVDKAYCLARENEARNRYADVETKRIAYMNDTSRFTSTYSWTDIMPLRALRFEGRDVNFPSKLEDTLERLYGDYMVLPPVEHRKNHYPARLSFGEYEERSRTRA